MVMRRVLMGALVILACAGVYAGITVWIPPIIALVHSANIGVPSQIDHQGVVTVNGARFTGIGQFRFALVDPDSGLNRWTNDGSHVGDSAAPASAVSLTVTDGIYSVRLGDTTLANMASPLAAAVFSDDNLHLRIWFDDGVNGSQQLSPDHALTSSPYCLSIADGVVSSSKLAAGAVGAAQIANGAVGAAQIANGAVSAAKLASDVALVPVGTLLPSALPAAPAGWLVCDGSAVSRTTYAVLFAAIGVTYGAGDGSTTFNVPDMRGRVFMGAGTGLGGGASGSGKPAGGSALSARSVGNWGGAETHTLTVAEMPAHTHSFNVTGAAGNGGFNTVGDGPAGNIQSAGILSAGGGAAHNNIQPFMVGNYIIKY